MIAPAAAAPRLSGLQRQVLSLYRECRRAAARAAGGAASRAALRARVRRDFRERGARVDRLDIMRIEFLMRQARKQIEAAASPGVAGFREVSAAGGGAGAAAGSLR